jgi:DNA-binding HxlR family transcriptional regulator
MALLDLLSRRWMLRLLWELREEALSFRALRARADDISPSVLNARLRELTESGIVELVPGDGYALTNLGRELVSALSPLSAWSTRWEKALGSA